jgi:hypothetical protein
LGKKNREAHDELWPSSAAGQQREKRREIVDLLATASLPIAPFFQGRPREGSKSISAPAICRIEAARLDHIFGRNLGCGIGPALTI